MMKILIILFFALAGFITSLPGEEKIEIDFSRPVKQNVNGFEYQFTGRYAKDSDGQNALAIGKDLMAKLPAKPLFGSKGAFFLDFKYLPVKDAKNALIPRYPLILRGEGRQIVAFYFCPPSEDLFFCFKETIDPSAIKSLEKIVPGQWYRLGASWDGRTVSCYINGVLQGQLPQTIDISFNDASYFAFGGFSDWSTGTPAWNEDTHLYRNLTVYNRPVSSAEAAVDGGKTLKSAIETYPSYLAIPKLTPPTKLDGKLDDPVWQKAASPVTLIDIENNAKSLDFKDNRPLLFHDGSNLYIGFSMLFPSSANLVKGSPRAPGADDVEAWGAESFELNFSLDGREYRFGGNMAGGSCESLNQNSKFTAPWEYVRSEQFQIDNSTLFQGEIKIPFASIGFDPAKIQKLKFNFSRTIHAFDALGLTSLVYGGKSIGYGSSEQFTLLQLLNNAESVQTVWMDNPRYGTLSGSFRFNGVAPFELKVSELDAAGSILPATIFEQSTAKAGEVMLKQPLTRDICNMLLVECFAGKTLLLRQLVPYQLSGDYLDVTPVYGQKNLLLTPRYSQLKSKLDGEAIVTVADPAGKMIFSRKVENDDVITVPFDRANPPGVYRAAITSVDGSKLYSGKDFTYSGVGKYEIMPPITRVLPPFTPVQLKQSNTGAKISVWGREYQIGKSLLPEVVTTQKQMINSAPLQLLVDGSPVSATPKFTASDDHRVDWTQQANSAQYQVKQTSYVEYDGIYVAKLALTAKAPIKSVTLSIPLTRSTARFLHATAGGFGAGGRVNHKLDGQTVKLPFFPVVWVGEYEHGLSFFSETLSNWKNAPPEVYELIQTKDGYQWNIQLGTNLKKGETLSLEYGFMPSPVRPLPENYPLNIFDDHFSVGRNRPAPAAPTNAFCLSSIEGAGFFNLPLESAEKPHEKWLRENLALGKANNSVYMPYTSAMQIPEEYTEAKINLKEWQRGPAGHLKYYRDGKSYDWYWLCPNSDGARNYYIWEFQNLLKRMPELKAIYFDFGAVPMCNNPLHGCDNNHSILAMRKFYQGIANAFVENGVNDYTIIIHNSEAVQVPLLGHVTHVFNGEGLRQLSSDVFHDGKDVLDTLTPMDWAMELSSLPFGVTSSAYIPVDPLLPQFGGGKEKDELYKFRMTKAALAGSLPHNTIVSASRLHFGFFDKLVRIYSGFDVPHAKFLPYWRNREQVRVLAGKDIYVSLYQSPDRPEVLAVVSHLGKAHDNQKIQIQFNPEALGFKKFTSCTEELTKPDPDYDVLYQETNRHRVPIELGDFGVRMEKLEDNVVTLELDFHSVAILKLEGERL